MLWRFLLALLISAPLVAAGEPEIIKVLPHLLDSQGRHALSPSLYERDAYQLYLREHKDEVSALRFDVQWKVRRDLSKNLKLRIEVRGSKTEIGKDRVYETSLPRGGMFSKWSSLTIDKNHIMEVGELLAWRASLWEDGQMIAKQESFLW